MKICFRTRFRIPFFNILLLLLVGLFSVYVLLHSDFLKISAPAVHSSTLMSLNAPAVSSLKLHPAPPDTATEQVLIGKNQTFSELMEQQGFQPGFIHQVVENAKPQYDLAQIHAGRSMEITTQPGTGFVKLRYEIDPLRTLTVARDNSGDLVSSLETRSVETSIRQIGGNIQGSLYNTINKLGEGDELVIRFADIFEWDVDFFKDLQAGDAFRIIYEKQSVAGRPYGYGRILAAELENKGRSYTAIGFQVGNNWEFYSPNGEPMKKAFLASPLKFSRITSGFSSHRYHPILHKYRPHFGTDYAAPYGTPVRAIGKGRIIFAGWAGGAGKTIKIQHDRSIQTFYCHLSRFGAGIRKGASVSQGQVIGYVGATGLATGPHLDFRFLRNGQYVNFLRIRSPQAEPLPPAEMARFKTESAEIIVQIHKVRLVDAPVEFAYRNGSQLSEGSF
jgi:murein DD-endopeptidase MepM/ murein hydrolase activator NlpD